MRDIIPCISCNRNMNGPTGTRLADGGLRCQCGAVVDFDYEGNLCSWHFRETDRRRYGWIRSEVVGVVLGWVVMLAAGYGTLWAGLTERYILAAALAVVMFVAACVASSSVPDGTTIRDSVGYLEGLHKHAYDDQGWDAARMEAEFKRGLRGTTPRQVQGGRKAIRRRLER